MKRALAMVLRAGAWFWCVAILMPGTATGQSVTPVSWWSAENGFNDVFGVNNGTQNGTVGIASGPVGLFGEAYHFDGTGYISVPNSPSMSPASRVEIVGWIKPDFPSNNYADVIMSKREGCYGERSYELVVYNKNAGSAYPPGTIIFGLSLGVEVGYPFPQDGNFHELSGIYDGQTMKLYVDGALVAQQPYSGAIEVTSGPALIGEETLCNSGTNAVADIAEVRFLSDEGFLLPGSNTFTGNQTINGNVTASAFLGNGSGLTNLSPANIASGTANINVSGTAASALSAGNASNLGGIAAANYARLDIANSLNGNQSVAGNVSITGTTTMGSGTPIIEHLSSTFNPSFPALKALTCASANFTFGGASDGDTLALGVPNARTTGGGTIVYFAWVSAANNVTIQACNLSQSPQKTAGSGAIRIDNWKH